MKLGAQVLFIFMLLVLLIVLGLKFSGFMQDRWASLSNQSNELGGRISVLEDGAYNLFNEKYPLDLRTTDYYSLKEQYEDVKNKRESHRALWRLINKLVEPAVYIILPFAMFSLPFVISVGIKRNRKLSALNYGFAFSSLMCIATFFYLLFVPVRCRDFECVVPLIIIPVTILILGIVIILTSYLVVNRIKNAS